MTTIVSTFSVARTQTRLSDTLFTIRQAHRDVGNYQQQSFSLSPGEERTLEVSNFLYLYMRDEITDFVLTSGTDGEPQTTIALKNVVGLFTWPTKCTLLLSVSGLSPILLARQVEVVYS